jgi:hypothetical protein
MAGSITFAQDVYAARFSVVTIAQLGLILIIVGNGWRSHSGVGATVCIKALWRWRDVQSLPCRVGSRAESSIKMV